MRLKWRLCSYKKFSFLVCFLGEDPQRERDSLHSGGQQLARFRIRRLSRHRR